MTTLLTAFNQFGSLKLNPTQLIVEEIGKKLGLSVGGGLVAEVLPTEFDESGNRIIQLIRRHRPDRVICLGVARGSEKIRLERVALNLDDCELQDNAGLLLAGSKIAPEGPLAYWSTLPIEVMLQALKQRGIPAVISNHAGTYVCNHVFYLARHEIERLGLQSQCGFIHVPEILEHKQTEAPPALGLPLEAMIEAVECCLGV